LKFGASEMDEKKITIVEHSGYLETMDDVFGIEPGEYTFTVKNESNKNSGFVVLRNGDIPQVVTIKRGEESNFKVSLKSGHYNYFCSLIPTPVYSIKVK
jgi:hypothetical protein